MITKAYISEVFSPNKVRVRVPLFNKIDGVNGSTPKNELSMACVCSLPNCKVAPQSGDVVLVGFEEDNTSKPVVLGFLSKESDISSTVDIKCEKLEALGDVILDKRTTIGKVTPENIECLEGLEDNVDEKFESLDTDIDKINEAASELKTKFEKSVEDTKKQFEDTNSKVDTNALDIGNLKGDLGALTTIVKEKMIKVGTHAPTLKDFDIDTQIYLWVQLEE